MVSHRIRQHRGLVLFLRGVMLTRYPPGWGLDITVDSATRTMRLTPAPSKGGEPPAAEVDDAAEWLLK
jgi:hypothetical protein